MKPTSSILIVDDLAANRQLLRELLEDQDYRIVEANSGAAALRLAAETPPDLVLLDVVMPDLNGFEVCRRLRADPHLAAVPVIMLTALNDSASRLAGIQAGADDFVTKPFNIVELRARVRAIARLNRYRQLVEAQSALQESEARFLQMAQHSDDVFWFATVNPLQFTFVGPAVQNIWGWPAARFREDALLWAKAIHPDDQPRVQAAYAAVLSGHVAQFIEEFRVVRPDGTVRWVLNRGTPVYDAAGQIASIGGVAVDVTERKQAEAEQREREERYRLLFDLNPVPMWLSDPATMRFLAVNAAAVQHYGYSAEEFLAMTIKDIYPPEDVPALLKFLAGETPAEASSGEARHRRKDGSTIRVEIISRPLEFGGRPARLVLASDVTEKKLLEEKFLHAQRLESIGMLAAGISHDLNNVLAPIVFAAAALRCRLSAPRDLKLLDTLEHSAGRGAGLVKQILGFAHCTTGEFRSTQVKHLARDIVEVIEATFPKTIQLHQEIPTELWPVDGNASQLHQVLLNLCINARDAMPQGGTLSVTVANHHLDEAAARAIRGASPGAWLRLEVVDTGTGIAPEVLENIWKPFFTTKGPGRGTGLGLSTVRGIVARHHGVIELETKVGRGSTFRVYLPAIDDESFPLGTVAPFALPLGHDELILVVDDEAPIRDALTDILGQHGYRVISCADGLAAIALFKVHHGDISLVITDVDMPNVGGVSLARALRQIEPNLRILAMSGSAQTDTVLSDIPAIKMLAHAFVLKPFKPDELLRPVHRLLRQAEVPMEVGG